MSDLDQLEQITKDYIETTQSAMAIWQKDTNIIKQQISDLRLTVETSISRTSERHEASKRETERLHNTILELKSEINLIKSNRETDLDRLHTKIDTNIGNITTRSLNKADALPTLFISIVSIVVAVVTSVIMNE